MLPHFLPVCRDKYKKDVRIRRREREGEGEGGRERETKPRKRGKEREGLHLLDFRCLLGELRAPFCHILPNILQVSAFLYLPYQTQYLEVFENLWPSRRACPHTRRRGAGCPVHCSARPQVCAANACHAPGSTRPAAQPGLGFSVQGQM